MNLRCTYCQTPFAIGRLEKLAAIQKMQAEDLHHYDVFCPRCRRANSVSRQRLEIFTPGWQEGLKTLEAEVARIEQERQEPVPAAPMKVKPAAETRRRHSPRPEPAAPTLAESTPKAKKTPTKAAPAAKSTSSPKGKPAAKAKSAPKAKSAAKSAAKAKPAAKKPASKAKPATKKPAAKKSVKKK